ncbi:hypothetical protein [Nocardia veterana]|uniref:Uncharacterized protein n=1 Tax=Nocardia veterana TaxID=132249 RepID=A0A7X6LU89_9NOCA|nr:hypothetical protein [Nocardia veterana]NKY84055.1 hypothetical protein [Nocardia veterana]
MGFPVWWDGAAGGRDRAARRSALGPEDGPLYLQRDDGSWWFVGPDGWPVAPEEYPGPVADVVGPVPDSVADEEV